MGKQKLETRIGTFFERQGIFFFYLGREIKMKSLFLLGFFLVLASSVPTHDTVKQQDDVESRGDVEEQKENEKVMESMRKFLATKSGAEMLDRLKKLNAYRSERQDDGNVKSAKKREALWGFLASVATSVISIFTQEAN